MKALSKTLERLALVVVLAATTASAQKEQWLQYHTSREGRGYRYLDLTTNPPPNLTLPKFSAQPWFAFWTSPWDSNGGRWLCFDRTRKSGPYDQLYIDSKGDGRLEKQTPVTTTRLDQYSASFEPARVVFKGEDGPLTYHLAVRFMKYERDDIRALVSSAGFYSGQIDIGGKKRLVEVIDGNVNGTFNDQAPDPSDCDRIHVDKDKLFERYLGKLLEVDGQFYKIEVARDGAFLKLQKAENVAMGRVRIPEGVTQFVAYGENGHFQRAPVKGEFTLPAGHYRIHEWVCERKDKAGATWQLMGSGFNDSAEFNVAVDKRTDLQVGEPIRVALTSRDHTNSLDFNLNFQGQYGESIQIEKGDQRPPGPRMIISSLDETYRSTNTFEFG